MTREMRERGWPRFAHDAWFGDGKGSRDWATKYDLLQYLEPEDRDSYLTRKQNHSFRAWLDASTPFNLWWNWRHQRPVHDTLRRVKNGKCKRLMIFMPPRHGKSELVTIRYSTWMMLKRPGTRVIIACYNQYLANKFSRSIKRAYKEWTSRFSKRQRASHRLVNTAAEWETPDGGGVKAVGVGAGITGFGGDLVIIDDPIKSRAEAESVNNRNAIWEWFNDDIRTRLENDAPIILIQTRWHEDDLAGRLLRQMENGGEQWEVVSLPALEEMRNAECGMRNKEGAGAIPHSALSTQHSYRALWPERFSVEYLLNQKRQMGSYSFESLYQQQPIPLEGSLFKRRWFEGKVIDAAPPNLRWCRGYDLAVSTKTSADYTASFRCAMDAKGNLYIADGYRARIEFPEQRKYIIERINAELNTQHGIESALHGQAFVQELMREEGIIGRAFKAVRVEGDKYTRALAWAGRVESGRVWLVRGPWIDDFIDEACRFPTGRHDDQIDAVSLAVQMLGEAKQRAYGF